MQAVSSVDGRASANIQVRSDVSLGAVLPGVPQGTRVDGLSIAIGVARMRGEAPVAGASPQHGPMGVGVGVGTGSGAGSGSVDAVADGSVLQRTQKVVAGGLSQS